MTPVRFPDGFAWGTASSAHQAEGGTIHNDWAAWEEEPGRIARGDRVGRGNDFWHRYDDDFALLAELGLSHHRLSIEWSRIEPEEGRVDDAALAHYERILTAARARGITPWVNLHHFALPRWFAARGGFLHERNLEPWRRHVARVGRAFAGLVAHWHPLNEPNYYALGGHLLGVMPPGLQDFAAFRGVLRTTMLAYRDAYHVLKTLDAEARVGPIHLFLPVFPADAEDADDRALASHLDAHWNALPLRALREGTIALPGEEPEPVDGLAGAADFFGANYYFALAVSARDPQRPTPHPPAQRRLSQIGGGVYPDGMRQVLCRVRDAGLGVPIYVTENGIGTDDDAWRIDYLRQHLAAVGAAIAEGCDVRGYFHWTSVDNFEWQHGWTAQFGLFAFDPQTFARQPRPSAQWLGAVARTNALPA